MGLPIICGYQLCINDEILNARYLLSQILFVLIVLHYSLHNFFQWKFYNFIFVSIM